MNRARLLRSIVELAIISAICIFPLFLVWGGSVDRLREDGSGWHRRGLLVQYLVITHSADGAVTRSYDRNGLALAVAITVGLATVALVEVPARLHRIWRSPNEAPATDAAPPGAPSSHVSAQRT